MSFPFDTSKMIEATATLLRHERGRKMSKKRLLALLYIGDRNTLTETGRPIVGGRLCAMKHGPVHCQAFDLVNGVSSDDPEWSEHFQLDGYHVCLTKDPGARHLSRYEVKVLEDLQRRYTGEEDWDVAEVAHEFPEYRDVWASRQTANAPTIPLEKIIEAIGRAADKERILKTAEEIKYYDSLFCQKLCPRDSSLTFSKSSKNAVFCRTRNTKPRLESRGSGSVIGKTCRRRSE